MAGSLKNPLSTRGVLYINIVALSLSHCHASSVTRAGHEPEAPFVVVRADSRQWRTIATPSLVPPGQPGPAQAAVKSSGSGEATGSAAERNAEDTCWLWTGAARADSICVEISPDHQDVLQLFIFRSHTSEETLLYILPSPFDIYNLTFYWTYIYMSVCLCHSRAT